MKCKGTPTTSEYHYHSIPIHRMVNGIHWSPPHSQNFWDQKAKLTTEVTPNEPTTSTFLLGRVDFRVTQSGFRISILKIRYFCYFPGSLIKLNALEPSVYVLLMPKMSHPKNVCPAIDIGEQQTLYSRTVCLPVILCRHPLYCKNSITLY